MLTGCAKSQKFAVCQVLPFLQELSSIVTFNKTSNSYFTAWAIKQDLSVKATNDSRYRWAQIIYFSYANKNTVSVASDIKSHVILMLISLAILIAVKLRKWISISTKSHLRSQCLDSKLFHLFVLLHIIDPV